MATHRVYNRYTKGAADAGFETDALIGAFIESAEHDSAASTVRIRGKAANGDAIDITFDAGSVDEWTDLAGVIPLGKLTSDTPVSGDVLTIITAGGQSTARWETPATGSHFYYGSSDPPGILGGAGTWYLQVPTHGQASFWYKATDTWDEVYTLSAIVNEPDADGQLPDPSDHQGEYAITPSGLKQSQQHTVHASTEREVTWADYDTAFDHNYVQVLNGAAHDFVPGPIGSVYYLVTPSPSTYGWIFVNSSGEFQSGISTSETGPAGYRSGNHYYRERNAESHVQAVGDVFYITEINRVRRVTAYTPPAAAELEWIWAEVGVTPQEVESAIDIAKLFKGVYSSTGTYKAPEIVRHTGTAQYFMYVSNTERSSDHDPIDQPTYWAELSAAATFITAADTTARHYGGGEIFQSGDDVYLCVSAIDGQAQVDIAGNPAFILLTDSGLSYGGSHTFGQSYEAGSIVYTGSGQNEQFWMAISTTTQTPGFSSSSNWVFLGGRREVVFRGTYSESGAYYKTGHMVQIGSDLYLRIGDAYGTVTNDGNAPDDVGQIGWSHINPGTTGTSTIADDSVTEAKLAAAVRAKLAAVLIPNMPGVGSAVTIGNLYKRTINTISEVYYCKASATLIDSTIPETGLSWHRVFTKVTDVPSVGSTIENIVYTIAKDASTVHENHRWNGQFYKAKRDLEISEVTMRVHPQVDNEYRLHVFKMTREANEDYRITGSDLESRVQDVTGAAQADVTYRLVHAIPGRQTESSSGSACARPASPLRASFARTAPRTPKKR